MNSIRRLAAVLLLSVFLITACGAPAPRRPISGAELQEISRTLGAALADSTSLRASGKGVLTRSGRGLHFRFAMLYDHRAWLRADIRPEVGFGGATFTAQALADGPCVELYLPARRVSVTGCVDEAAEWADALNPSALLLGLIDSDTLLGLENPLVRERADRMEVSGALGGMDVVFTFELETGYLTRVTATPPGSDSALNVSYSGRRRTVGGLVLPGRVEIRTAERRPDEQRVEIVFSSIRSAGEIVRGDYAIDVPVDATAITWEDLNLWGDEQ